MAINSIRVDSELKLRGKRQSKGFVMRSLSGLILISALFAAPTSTRERTDSKGKSIAEGP